MSDFVLLFIVRIRLFAAGYSPLACWCCSACVVLFSQVRVVYLIFAVPQIQERGGRANSSTALLFFLFF